MCWIRITIHWVWSLESIKKTLVWQLMHNENDVELAFLYESSIVGSYFSTKIPWTNWTVWRAREKEEREGKTKRKDMFIKCNDTQTCNMLTQCKMTFTSSGWLGNSILNTPRPRGFCDCLWHEQDTAGHYRSPCPENHVGAHTKMPMATSQRIRPEWNPHSLVKYHKAFRCCWDTSYLAINYGRKLIDDNQRLEVNCRGSKNNCVETKDRIKGNRLCSDFTGSVVEVGNMKIMWCCPQVRRLQGLHSSGDLWSSSLIRTSPA